MEERHGSGPDGPGREAADAAPGTDPVLDLDSYVPGQITHLANKLARDASALYRRHVGVGLVEWRVLALLAREPGATAQRVCQVIGLDKGAVSRAVATLEAHRLVAPRADAGDGRRRRLTLTPTGRVIHGRALAIALERERRLLACLTDRERSVLRGLLRRLDANLEAVNAPLDVPPGPRAGPPDGSGAAPPGD